MNPLVEPAAWDVSLRADPARVHTVVARMAFAAWHKAAPHLGNPAYCDVVCELAQPAPSPATSGTVATSMIPSNRGFIDYCAEGLDLEASVLERDARAAADPGHVATLSTIASLLRQSAESARAARRMLAKDCRRVA